jgi:hypothetical protein
MGNRDTKLCTIGDINRVFHSRSMINRAHAAAQRRTVTMPLPTRSINVKEDASTSWEGERVLCLTQFGGDRPTTINGGEMRQARLCSGDTRD